ncbi:hypothetical protein TWF694_000481 [Orbilia ellipsospora]|uniref:Uncharacterized protein n=1 Tax=Orbilia ellipsospora TaxID=2528407 RepID=A0AAV9XP22_9PEZI
MTSKPTEEEMVKAKGGDGVASSSAPDKAVEEPDVKNPFTFPNEPRLPPRAPISRPSWMTHRRNKSMSRIALDEVAIPDHVRARYRKPRTPRVVHEGTWFDDAIPIVDRTRRVMFSDKVYGVIYNNKRGGVEGEDGEGEREEGGGCRGDWISKFEEEMKGGEGAPGEGEESIGESRGGIDEGKHLAVFPDPSAGSDGSA